MEEAILFNHWTFEHQFSGEASSRVWKLERAKPPMKAAYGKHLERLVVQGIQRHRDTLDDFAFKAAMGEWNKGFIGGAYNWRSPLFWESLDHADNRLELAWHWFQQSEARLPPREQMKFQQFREMWDAKGKEITALLVEMCSEQNPTPAPASKEETASR